MTPQWISLWVNVAVVLLGFVGGSIGLGYFMSNKMNEMMATIRGDYEAHIANLEKKVDDNYEKNDEKVKRVYQRHDEYKRHIEDKLLPEYVRKDLCGVMHSSTTNEIKGLRDDMKVFSDKLDRFIEGQAKK